MSSTICGRLRGLFHNTPNTISSRRPKANFETPNSKSSQGPDVASLVKKFKNSSDDPSFRRRFSHYEATVRRLAQSHQHSSIRNILEHQKQYADITEEPFVVRLIGLYGKAKMLDEAQKLFDEMPSLNCKRTVVSFNALLAASISSNKFDKTNELFKELPKKFSIEPDVVSYNTVIKAFCDKGSLDSAVLMMNEMERNGITPDLVTYNTLLDAYYSEKRISEGEKLWDLMRKKNVVADVRSYNSRLRCLGKDNRVLDAVELIYDMGREGVNPDRYSYNALIKGFVDDGNMEQAKRWFNVMIENGCVPDWATFGMLIPFACDKEDFDYAYHLCTESIRLNRKVYHSTIQRVIDGLVATSKNGQAKKLMKMAR